MHLSELNRSKGLRIFSFSFQSKQAKKLQTPYLAQNLVCILIDEDGCIIWC
jgi:hypothetical protein